MLPSFGTHWLLPRLQRFVAQNPEITVSLGTRLAPFDFSREPFDAAIHFGARGWPGVEYLDLAGEEIIPACAPHLVPEGPIAARDLLSMPLLHLESRPGAWEDWFTRQGCEAGNLRGMLFDQFAQMAEAAALGLGVALLPQFLAEAEFAAQRLRPLAADYTAVDGRYFAVWPQFRPPSRALQRLLKWLQSG